jgi:hypothetical protein
MIEGVHSQIKFSIQYVVKYPLVIIREVVIESHMDLVWQLNYFTVSCWIHETWLKIVMD